MKKLTFKVSSQKDFAVASLIKEVNNISCRIYLDLEHGFVTVENVNDTMIDAVIELVDNYYTILSVDIDNTLEESIDKQDITVVAESTADITDNAVEKTVEEVAEVVAKKQPTVSEPQSEDDLIIKKLEFQNENIEYLMNKFLKTTYWAMFKMSAPEHEIGKFILSTLDEISMKYSSQTPIEFSVGDIVDCNYGMHLVGEINGNHVNGIVCHVLNNMAYVVPITKVTTGLTSKSYLFIDVPHDVTYENKTYGGGTALIDKGKYLRTERFHSVIGKTKPDFFKKLLHQLVSTFDFTDYLVGAEKEDTTLPSENDNTENQTVNATESSKSQVSENSATTEDSTNEISGNLAETVESKSSTKNISVEDALSEVIGPSLGKLDKSKSVKEQVEGFMLDIGIPTNVRFVAEAFVIACDIKKINYENVVLGLHTLNPNVREDIIIASLKETFKRWLEQYPTLVEKCPKISFTTLLKAFAKRFA